MKYGQQPVEADHKRRDVALAAQGAEADIIDGLQSARVMIRALAQTMDDDDRLQLAHAFGETLVRSWWDASCQKAQAVVGLRSPHVVLGTVPLTEALDSIAQSAGKLAANLEPEIAAYQIGLTYTYVLPAAYRSAHGIYYTPPVLTDRLIRLATQTGVDWSSCPGS